VRKFRKGAVYAPDAACYRAIDREARVKILNRAEVMEVRTKQPGQRSGVLGQSGLRVLRCLLIDFCNVPTGRCCPGYKAIKAKTGFALNTIAGALHRLENSGLLQITRRLIRTSQGARQATNAYVFHNPSPALPEPDLGQRRETNTFKNLSLGKQLPELPKGLAVALDRLGARIRIKEACS
jgi:hypothetical protein